jgi:glycosyltransferase involved in cell wall biosynthesis
MVRILQFAIAASQGGYTQYITNIWRCMDKSKVHFDFVTFSKTVDFAEEFINDGCQVYQISAYPEEDMETFIAEFGSVLNQKYDAIEIHTSFWKSTIVEKMAKEKGVKVIVHAHSTGISKAKSADEEAKLLKRHIEIKRKIDASLADYFFACSQSAADWLYGEAIPKDKIKFINNTINTDRFAFSPESREWIRKQLKLQNKFVIGHVGRLERVKNQQFLIEIFAEIHMEINHAILLMVGDGSLREDLEKIVWKLGIVDSVIFVGKKADTESYYQAMDVFVLPSLLEGFPLVLLEAQCSGLECICSEGVPQEALIIERTERIPLSNREKWVQKIKRASYQKVREDSSKIIMMKGFDTNQQIKEIEKIYQSMNEDYEKV